MSGNNKILLLLITSILSSPVLAEQSPLVTINRLTLETSLEIAKAAIDSCRKKGVQITATVVDRDGTVQVVLRDTVTAPIATTISKQKAFTAVNFNVPTSQLDRQASSPLSNVEGLLMSSGGIPIKAGGQLLGGIGVSGAPSGKTDEECAQAGIDKVKDDLEMAF
ncbi:MAG TPA: heme-binding protein [Gammaproteobacteria bacterium]|nr:heme-binding protein [Gammaproteobacteria bacterium]